MNIIQQYTTVNADSLSTEQAAQIIEQFVKQAAFTYPIAFLMVEKRSVLNKYPQFDAFPIPGVRVDLRHIGDEDMVVKGKLGKFFWLLRPKGENNERI